MGVDPGSGSSPRSHAGRRHCRSTTARRATSALVDDGGARRCWSSKGHPNRCSARCVDVPDAAQRITVGRCSPTADASSRWPARAADGLGRITAADETGLHFDGFLVFADNPKSAARESLAQLAALGIEVKIATGDNPQVAEKVCADLGLASKGTVTGAQLEQAWTTLNSTQSARRQHDLRPDLARAEGPADHLAATARAGRSASSATASTTRWRFTRPTSGSPSTPPPTSPRTPPTCVLLEKDLGVLAAGVAEGRRIFANTIKYVLMGTSSNFGNMFSAAAASAVLPFLPMLPSQILLNNLLYDSSQLAIPTDRVDDEQLHAPSHWNIAFIRRFMLTFGPISSLFDFLTFGLMLGVLHAGPVEFRTGWFVESLATQTLIIFAIRTRRRCRSSAASLRGS